MKVFISQPMSGRTEAEIFKERNEAINILKTKYGREIEIVDSFFSDDYRESIEKSFKHIINHFPVYWLGMALGYLSEADTLAMCGDWGNSKGCKIEKMCAETYGIDIIYL